MNPEDILPELKKKPYKAFGKELTFKFGEMLNETDNWKSTDIEKGERFLDFKKAFLELGIIDGLPKFDPAHRENGFTGFVDYSEACELDFVGGQTYADAVYFKDGIPRYSQEGSDEIDDDGFFFKSATFMKDGFIYRIDTHCPGFLLQPDERWSPNSDEIDWDTVHEGFITNKKKSKVYFLDDGKTRLYVEVMHSSHEKPMINIQVEPRGIDRYFDGTFGSSTVQVWMDKEEFGGQLEKALQAMYYNPKLFENKEDILKVFGDVNISPHSEIFGSKKYPADMISKIEFKGYDDTKVKLSEVIDIIQHYKKS